MNLDYRIAAGAFEDIETEADYYEAREPTLGDDFTDAVQGFVTDLRRLPQKFARVKRYPKNREIREGKLERFPHVIVYEVRSTEIVVLSVTHPAKRNRPWRKRLGD